MLIIIIIIITHKYECVVGHVMRLCQVDRMLSGHDMHLEFVFMFRSCVQIDYYYYYC